MMDCKEAAKLISSGERPGFFKRMELYFHLLICDACRIYRAQMAALKKAAAGLVDKIYEQHRGKAEAVEEETIRKIREGL